MKLREDAKEKILECPDICRSNITVSEYEGGTFRVWENVSVTDVPPCLRVFAELYPEKGSYIKTELWLPYDWNGIFLGTGNGGMAGHINYAPLCTRIKQGYAVANTDMGTMDGIHRGIKNPAVHKDFGWRATHLMTVLAKAHIRAAYGEDIRYSYFLGGSTGGEQALAEAQRFPEDYDGISAGAPANNRVCLHTYFLWNFLHAKDGHKQPLFSEEECRAVHAAAVKFSQSRGDGQPEDRFVSLPLSGKQTIRDYMAFLREECPGMTEKQYDSLNKIYSGPINPRTGERIYNGIPMGSELYPCGLLDLSRGERCPFEYPFYWALGADFDISSFDFDRDLERVVSALSADMDANDPNLTPFFAHGGKLISATGTADAIVPFQDTLYYFHRVHERCGGLADEGMRYYTVPSRDHAVAQMSAGTISSDGKSGDLLDVLRQWREEGKAPQSLYAHTCAFGETEVTAREIQPCTFPARTEEFPCCDERYLAGKAVL